MSGIVLKITYAADYKKVVKMLDYFSNKHIKIRLVVKIILRKLGFHQCHNQALPAINNMSERTHAKRTEQMEFSNLTNFYLNLFNSLWFIIPSKFDLRILL